MNEFLKQWDKAIQQAQETGEEQILSTVGVCECGAFKLATTARTMHPSFMSGPIPKWDPNRDKED